MEKDIKTVVDNVFVVGVRTVDVVLVHNIHFKVVKIIMFKENYIDFKMELDSLVLVNNQVDDNFFL